MKDDRQVGCLDGKDAKLAVNETAKQARLDNEAANNLKVTSYEEIIEKGTNGAEYDDDNSKDDEDIVFKSRTKRSNVVLEINPNKILIGWAYLHGRQP